MIALTALDVMLLALLGIAVVAFTLWGATRRTRAWVRAFESPRRAEWQEVERLLDMLELGRTETVADVGAATGYFTLPLARRVPDGKVYAVDVEPVPLRYLSRRARRAGLRNIVRRLGTLAGLPPVDALLLVNTYRFLDRPDALSASVKPGGRLLVVDWLPGTLPFGPPAERKVNAEQLRRDLEAQGFVLQRELTLRYQFAWCFTLSASRNR